MPSAVSIWTSFSRIPFTFEFRRMLTAFRFLYSSRCFAFRSFNLVNSDLR